MKAILPLTIVGTVVAFLVAILAAFPVQGIAVAQSRVDVNNANFSKQSVEEAGNKFSSMYASVVDDLLSYQKDPSYERAEERRQAVTSYGEFLVNEFHILADSFQNKLDELTNGVQDRFNP